MLLDMLLFLIEYISVGIIVGVLYLVLVKYDIIEWQDHTARETIFKFSLMAWPLLIIMGAMVLIFTVFEKLFELVDDRIFPS